MPCVICNNPARPNRQTCSQSCAAKLGYKTQGTPPWEPDALAWLELHSGCHPGKRMTSEFNRAANRNGWMPRTAAAIRCQMNRLALSARPTEANWNTGTLARTLGCSHSRTKKWRRDGAPFYRVGQRWSITADGLRAWLRANPDRAFGLDRESLAWVIGPDAANQILAAAKQPTGIPRPVRRVSDGRIFPSLRAAAQAVHVEAKSIGSSIRREGTCAGYRWEYV